MINFFENIAKLFKTKIMFFIGIINLLYFIAITAFIGYLNIYNLIWIFIGLLFIFFYKMKGKISGLYKKIPKILKLFSIIVITVFLLSFIIIEGFIINDAQNKNIENANYVIILGAGLNGSSPSLTLLQRINVAIDYLKKNTNVDVIVSGGKGFRETFTEAEVMSKLLQNNGIESNRIILEDRSTNTYENLVYSGKLIDLNKKIVIVSSGFHLFRAKNIAKKIGYKNIGGIASKTPLLLLPNYYVREYLAIIKEITINNM
jgi:uncharacterized SAM-binding protein YcdF (DUF218 family)